MYYSNKGLFVTTNLKNMSKYMLKSCKDFKKKARDMSRSGKVLRTFEFLRIFGAAEKIQAKYI